jgi:predicted metal-dependent HD superfamily phosphohydrolase
MLKDVFYSLCGRLGAEEALTDEMWAEVEGHYTERGRHYHTLQHLENLIGELEPYMGTISDPDMLLFSVFYHDIIYNVLKGDNEEKSAELAIKRLKALGVAEMRTELCRQAILATKSHKMNGLRDINLFTDADLSVLGKDEETYCLYAAAVRKEYGVYPALMYNQGRKKAMKHFLEMERIYKTPEFAAKYEETARRNIANELRGLGLHGLVDQ